MKIAVALVAGAALVAPAAPALAASATPAFAAAHAPNTAPGTTPTPTVGGGAPGAQPGGVPTPTAGAGTAVRPGGPATAPTVAAPGVAAAARPAGIAPAAATGGAGAATTGGAGAGAAAAGTPALVARYNFDGGAVAGKFADSSGRGTALALRSANQGVVRVLTSAQGGRYLGFPAACARGAQACPRALLEAPDDADLNPGTRTFRWSARVQVAKTQLAGSANVMQKGVVNTGSQWKMQIGATQGRAQCVVVGAGSTATYVVKSTISVADGQWHKVLCQRSGSTLTVFVDNVARGQAGIPAALSITNRLPLRVGGPNFAATSDMYHGQLDDVYAELG